MRVEIALDGLEAVLADANASIARSITGAMRDATNGLKGELRQQVRDAGLGPRLATTWQGNVYPETGTSLEPAGYVYSRAPRIIGAYASGATIVAVNGSRLLAIPTDRVPFRAGSRGVRVKMTPVEVEATFNQELIVRRGKNGHLLLFINVTKAKSVRRPGYRKLTPRRVAAGRKSELVLMFVLVPRVQVPRLLDLDAAAQKWGSAIEPLFQQRLAR